MDTKAKFINGQATAAYTRWRTMLRRAKIEGTPVSPMFADYSLFQQWYQRQLGVDHPTWRFNYRILGASIGWHEEVALFVPVDILLSIQIEGRHRPASDLPTGVQLYDLTAAKPYGARMMIDGVSRWLGSHATIEEARTAYLRALRSRFHFYSLVYKGQIDERLYKLVCDIASGVTELPLSS